MNNQAMAQALRDLAQQQRRQQLTQQPEMQNQNSPDLSTNILQGLTKYNDTSGGGLNRMLSGSMKGGGGAAASGGSAAGAGGTGFGLGQPLVSGGVGSASFAGGGAAAGSGAAAGGAGAGGALMSNPWTAIAAAIIGGANYLDNKDISSWSDTLKGKAGGNMLDYYGGRDDGKTHGLIGKLHDKDRAPGQMTKAMTDLSELDFGNAFKNAKDGIKSIFKLRF